MSISVSPDPRTRWGKGVLFGLGGSLIVSLIVLAFLWPVATSSPRDLPLVIAGPSEQTAAVEQALDTQSDGLFAFTEAKDRAEAVSAIEKREAYGAIVLGQKPEVLVASAANSAVAQQLTGVGAKLQQMLAQQVKAAGGDPSQLQVAVTDVVPLADTDPNGAGLAVASFPLTLGGIIGGMLVSFLVVGSWRKLTALTVYAVGAGLLVAAILQPWFGVLQGSFILNALVIGLSMFATGSLIVGLHSFLGRGGAVLGAILTLFVGNPISAATMPHQFLAGAWGDIGQGFVPGAASTLLRSVSYFPEAATSAQWWTLVIWSAAGIVLLTLGRLRRRAAEAKGVVTATSAA
ncbi:hypothetical protein G7068_01955 [Leucobacter viscericola]|uniref:ABC transporter permease n=1 Tax=Leucobacter viscericola TaxID=2714935 RepID=A0A6G7XC70_9MICO|nr:hypothetical protein [Leucobacter viscericola]QIK62102.1 hypothetical protein G7068_01955 [Leucobacter viscericola]